MNYCQNCGDTLGEKSRYCKTCGNFLKPVEKFSIDEGSAKFCNKCGSAVTKQYCPACGSYGKEIKLKTSGLSMGKFLGSVGNQNIAKQKKNRNEVNQENRGSVKELFGSLFSVKEDLKTTALNAGIFALILAFVLGAIVYIANTGIISAIVKSIVGDSVDIDLLQLKQFEEIMDFKPFLWSVLTGSTINGNLSGGVGVDVNLGISLPFIGFPILILLIILIELIRKVLLKSERTFYMAVMQSGIFAVFSAMLTSVLSYKQTYTSEKSADMIEFIYDTIGGLVTISDRMLFTISSSAGSVFFTTFFITLLVLLIMPGLKVENQIWKEIQKTVTVFLGVILCMTVIPGMVSAIICVNELSGLNFGAGILIFVLATGMYSISIFTGNTEWCNFKATLPEFMEELEMGTNALIINAKTTWTEFLFSFTDNDFSANNSSSSSMPFDSLHICMIVVGVIAALYLSAKLWKNLSCDWAMAAVISVVIGGGCSVFLPVLHKLFRIGAELKINNSIMRVETGTFSTLPTFFKETIGIAVVCMIGFAIWYFAGNTIGAFLVLKKRWVTWAVGVCCIVLSFGTISGITLKSFRPVTENVVAVVYDYFIENVEEDYVSDEGLDRSTVIREATDEFLSEVDLILNLLEDNPEMLRRYYFGY